MIALTTFFGLVIIGLIIHIITLSNRNKYSTEQWKQYREWYEDRGKELDSMIPEKELKEYRKTIWEPGNAYYYRKKGVSPGQLIDERNEFLRPFQEGMRKPKRCSKPMKGYYSSLMEAYGW